jgi:endonuclease-8
MEGPSLHALADRLRRLEGQTISSVAGNARQPIEQLEGRRIERVRAVKKRLVIETDGPAAVFHFYMWGTYRINDRREAPERLRLVGSQDAFNTYHCSAKVLTPDEVAEELDPRGDVLSQRWDRARALQALAARAQPVADVLLDQDVFGGVGNIVKNEALWRAGVHPRSPARLLSAEQRQRVTEEAVAFTEAWYERGGPYPDEAGSKIYRAGTCPTCEADVVREDVGTFDRITFWCPDRQVKPEGRARPPAGPEGVG